MSWTNFIWFALPAGLLWATGAILALKQNRKAAIALTIAGLLVFMSFIAGYWFALSRPPLRTMGETRLWYSFFLPVVGLMVYLRWQYKWILSFSSVMALVFICVNLFKPEIHNKTLMPALQSPWFVPHVVVYMFAYAIFGVSTLVALYLIIFKNKPGIEQNDLLICDNLVYTGVGFLTLGMLFGAIWAKQAWGHYWTWDPKETWAAATWLGYLVYIHYRLQNRRKNFKISLTILLFSFLLLQICWFGVNYLPSAKGVSIHSY